MRTVALVAWFLSIAMCLSAVAAETPQIAEMFNKGDEALRAKKYEDAGKIFRDANKLSGDKCSSCLVRLGYALLRQDDERGALKSVDRALQVATDAHDRFEAHAMRAYVLGYFANEDRKKLAAAEAEYRAAEQEQASAVFHQRIGALLIRQGKDEEGIKELNSYLEASPAARDAEEVRKWIADPRRLRFEFAPEFSLTTSTGEAVSLASLAGKTVLIDFWATWCPPCRASVPELKELRSKYGEKLVILSISADDDEKKWSEFVSSHKMDWPQYYDGNATVRKVFGVHAFPTYLLIDKEGIIRQKVEGLQSQQTLHSRLKDQLKKLLEPS